LSKEQIDAIVEARATTKPPATHAVVVNSVRREAALQPANAQYLLGTQSLMVGHRVAYIAERGPSALFGAHGFIVAIHARETAQPASRPSNGRHMEESRQEGLPADKIHMVEILLDKPFANGTTLDGKCPPYRGALVHPTQVLDLTSWGLGQNVASRPSAGPRTVDKIRPVPVPAAHPKRGDTAAMAAKARATLGRPAPGGAGQRSATSVDVPEPLQAPWAAARVAGTRYSAEDDERATQIISALTAGPTMRQAASLAAAPRAVPVPAAHVDGDAHAQNIINTLLAGSVARMSLGAGSSAGNRVVLESHPLVSGQHPILVEDAYCSDSFDEDDGEGEGAP
ncbi:exonuclease II Exo2, partial [Coemansia spiralis]